MIKEPYDIPIRPKYKCRNCGHEFERPEPGPAECERCDHLYVDWLNWKEIMAIIWRERGFID